MHQHQQQRGVDSKFNPYAKKDILISHDRFSSCWYVWPTQNDRLMKSSYIILWPEERLRDTVGEIKTVDWSDCE